MHGNKADPEMIAGSNGRATSVHIHARKRASASRIGPVHDGEENDDARDGDHVRGAALGPLNSAGSEGETNLRAFDNEWPVLRLGAVWREG